eukprot:1518723-Prymnesium_polylepis.4
MLPGAVGGATTGIPGTAGGSSRKDGPEVARTPPLDELNAALGGVRFTAVSPLTRATSWIWTSTRSCVSSGACHWESHNVFG